MPPETETVTLPDAVADVLVAQIARAAETRTASREAIAAAEAQQALLEGLFHGALVALGVPAATRARAMLLTSGRAYALAPESAPAPSAPDGLAALDASGEPDAAAAAGG